MYPEITVSYNEPLPTISNSSNTIELIEIDEYSYSDTFINTELIENDSILSSITSAEDMPVCNFYNIYT